MAFSPSLLTNLLSEARQPVNFCTSFTVCGNFMLSIAPIFFGLASIPRLKTRKTEQLASWHAEGALGGVELVSEPPKVRERLLKVIEQASALFCLDDNIVHLYLHIFANLIMQTFLHIALISGASVSQTEGHGQIAINPIRGDK